MTALLVEAKIDLMHGELHGVFRNLQSELSRNKGRDEPCPTRGLCTIALQRATFLFNFLHIVTEHL